MNYLKSFEYTKDIVAAKMQNSTVVPNKSNGKLVAEFFVEIFEKLSELENKYTKE